MAHILLCVPACAPELWAFLVSYCLIAVRFVECVLECVRVREMYVLIVQGLSMPPQLLQYFGISSCSGQLHLSVALSLNYLQLAPFPGCCDSMVSALPHFVWWRSMPRYCQVIQL